MVVIQQAVAESNNILNSLDVRNVKVWWVKVTTVMVLLQHLREKHDSWYTTALKKAAAKSIFLFLSFLYSFLSIFPSFKCGSAWCG